MYRHLTLTACILALSSGLFAQPQPRIKSLIDEIIEKGKTVSPYGRTIKWDTVRARMYHDARNATTVDQLAPALQTFLKYLNDPSAGFSGHGLTSGIPKGKASQETKVMLKPASKPEYRMLDEGIAYLNPGSPHPDSTIESVATAIRAAVDTLSATDPGKWILDLRQLNQGSINSVLSGLAPLVGEGQVAALTNSHGHIVRLYEIHNGNFYDDQHLVVRLDYKKPLHHDRLAILISGNTCGPGEVVSIMFKGRKNVRFFGASTCGELTIAGEHSIGSDMVMTLSEKVYQDRKGMAYLYAVRPDSEIQPDAAMTKAIEWIVSDVGQEVAAGKKGR